MLIRKHIYISNNALDDILSHFDITHRDMLQVRDGGIVIIEPHTDNAKAMCQMYSEEIEQAFLDNGYNIKSEYGTKYIVWQTIEFDIPARKSIYDAPAYIFAEGDWCEL